MALATKCPHCQTTFRVAHDQLKLRTGLVRCGHCKEIFNGIEHLLPPDEAVQAAAPSSSVTSGTAGIVAQRTVKTPSPAFESESASAKSVEVETTAARPSASSAIGFEIPAAFERDIDVVPPAALEEAEPTDPLQRMTLLDFKHELPDSIDDDQKETSAQEFSNAEEEGMVLSPNSPDELDEAINDLQRKPWRGTKKSTKEKETDALDAADSEDEPDFLKRARRKQRWGRKLRIFVGMGTFILFIAALAQATYLFRNQIAGLFPQSKPVLAQVCNVVGCRIELPSDIATVSIESSELQTLVADKNTFVLAVLLRNDSHTLQEWPYIELTLNDANEKPLLRRVFKPADYLGNVKDVRSGFAAASERSLKLSFELAQIKASGYRVYLFYP